MATFMDRCKRCADGGGWDDEHPTYRYSADTVAGMMRVLLPEVPHGWTTLHRAAAVRDLPTRKLKLVHLQRKPGPPGLGWNALVWTLWSAMLAYTDEAFAEGLAAGFETRSGRPAAKVQASFVDACGALVAQALEHTYGTGLLEPIAMELFTEFVAQTITSVTNTQVNEAALRALLAQAVPHRLQPSMLLALTVVFCDCMVGLLGETTKAARYVVACETTGWVRDNEGCTRCCGTRIDNAMPLNKGLGVGGPRGGGWPAGPGGKYFMGRAHRALRLCSVIRWTADVPSSQSALASTDWNTTTLWPRGFALNCCGIFRLDTSTRAEMRSSRLPSPQSRAHPLTTLPLLSTLSTQHVRRHERAVVVHAGRALLRVHKDMWHLLWEERTHGHMSPISVCMCVCLSVHISVLLLVAPASTFVCPLRF